MHNHLHNGWELIPGAPGGPWWMHKVLYWSTWREIRMGFLSGRTLKLSLLVPKLSSIMFCWHLPRRKLTWEHFKTWALAFTLGFEGQASYCFQKFAWFVPAKKSCFPGFLGSMFVGLTFQLESFPLHCKDGQGCPSAATSSEPHGPCLWRKRLACFCLGPLQSIRGSVDFHGRWEKLELTFQEQTLRGDTKLLSYKIAAIVLQ